MTTEKPTKVTVAWCPVHKWWLDADEIGERCIEGGQCNRTLVKRVGYLCNQEGFHRLQREARECQDDYVG